METQPIGDIHKDIYIERETCFFPIGYIENRIEYIIMIILITNYIIIFNIRN